MKQEIPEKHNSTINFNGFLIMTKNDEEIRNPKEFLTRYPHHPLSTEGFLENSQVCNNLP